MGKLDLRQLGIAYTGATVASVSTGLVGSYVWSKFGYDVDYGLVVASSWLLTVGVPSLIVSMETLRRTLGERKPVTVTVGGDRRGRRAIPVTANGKPSHVFLSSIPWLRLPEGEVGAGSSSQAGGGDPLPQTFTVEVEGNNYSVTIDEVETFVRGAWRRQLRGAAAFSRPYWTREHRPRLKPIEYYTRLNVLLSCTGLVLDRGPRRSGRLAVPPATAVKALQGQFALV